MYTRFRVKDIIARTLARIGPGGVDFTAGNIFDVIPVAHIIVGGGIIAYGSVVNNNIFRDNYFAQHDFSGFIYWLDFRFLYFGRILVKKCVWRNDDTAVGDRALPRV